MVRPVPAGTMARRDGRSGPAGRTVTKHKARRTPVSQRAAAAFALLALVAAGGLLLAGVVVHLGAVLLAVAALLVCVTAAWYAVSRRGLVRATALAVMVAALAGLGAGLAFAQLSALALGLVTGLAAASAAAGRYALRARAARSPVATGRLTAAPRPGRPVLVMNLKSGGGKAGRFRLAEECERRGIEPVVLRPGDDLRKLAEDAADRGADAIGMAGGDGSQALVADVASRRGIPHVCVPAGTRNHFALDLGLDRDDVVGALDAFSDGVERRVDLASVNGRIFVNNASLGLYATVIRSPEYRDAKLATAAAVLPDVLGPDAVPLDLRFRGPDADYSTAHLILVSNDPYRLDSLGEMGTRDRLDLGMLGVVTATISSAGDARRLLALEASGQVRRFRGWHEWQTPRFEVSSAGPVDIGIDGEALVMDPPLVFEALPGALRVRLPRRAVRLSKAQRAARLLSRSAITELAETAAAGNSPLAGLVLVADRPAPSVRHGAGRVGSAFRCPVSPAGRTRCRGPAAAGRLPPVPRCPWRTGARG
jgi:diacylglycerol kinase family enzyme